MPVPGSRLVSLGIQPYGGTNWNAPQLAATVAALRLLSVTGLSLGATVEMQGTTARNDGGQGLFYYDPTGTGTDDGKNIIQPSVGAGRWFRLVSSSVVNAASAAALRLVSVVGVPSGFTINLLGNTTINDGGQGAFYYSPSGVGADDGINIIAPTSGAGRWFRIQGLSAVASNVAAIKAINYNFYSDGATISLSGHVALGIGGGLFRIDKTDTTTADDNGLVFVATDGTRVKRIFSGSVFPEWFGAKGDGTANDTAGVQSALSSGLTVELIAGKTYAVTKGATYYTLTSPASLILRGNGATIKLASAAANCCILGNASEITSVKISDTTFDGNKATVSGVGTVGVYFPNIHRFESRNNIYTGFKNTGSVTVPTGGKGIFLGDVTQCEWAISDADTFTNMDHHGFQSYRTLQQTVKDGFFNGHIVSCIDTNPLTAPGQNDRTKISITNNVMNCGGGFAANFSVISLMGDDVECVGNKITGGQVGIVVHTASGYTGSLRNYNVSENYLWNQLAGGIAAAQDVNASITIHDNHVYKAIGSAISVFGNYSGPYTKTEGLISVTDNHVYDGVVGSTYTQTNEPAGIKLSGVFNTTVSGNQIYKPRFAGVQIISDSQNVVISNNIITDHVGQASTTAPTFTGGGIVLSDEGTYALLSSIIIEANIIKNYLTADAGSSSIRTGGIVVNGGGTNVADVTVRDNIIDNGNGNGISVYNTTRTVLQNNIIRNYYNSPIVLNTAADTIWADGQVNSKIGTTGNRPTTPGDGATYFDTTIGKPIWWNGANWKDATGTTV